MTATLTTTIRIDDWQEQTTRDFDDGTRIAHAVVQLSDGRYGLTSVHMEAVLHYWADGTSRYATVLRLDGALEGRSGSFVAVGDGEYDGTTAAGSMRIVSGTGELGRIVGTVSSASTHEDYPSMPLMIAYDLP